VEVDDLVVGVRSNDVEMLELARAVLRPSLARAGDASPNLSVLAGEQQGRIRVLHQLFRHGWTVLRTGSTGRLLRALIAELDGFLPAPEGLLALDGALLVGERGAVVAPVNGVLQIPDRQLARLGLRRVDVAAPLVDEERLDVVVVPPRIDFDHMALADADDSPGDAQPAATPVRYPLRAVIVFGANTDDRAEPSPARRLGSLAPLVGRGHGPIRAHDLAVVSRLAARCDVAVVPRLDDVSTVLTRLAAAG
jgi:hypothetical protein